MLVMVFFTLQSRIMFIFTGVLPALGMFWLSTEWLLTAAYPFVSPFVGWLQAECKIHIDRI